MNKPMTEEELFSFDQEPTGPSKSLQQLLAENPHHAGGLAQLAAAEKAAWQRCIAERACRSMPSPSTTKP